MKTEQATKLETQTSKADEMETEEDELLKQQDEETQPMLATGNMSTEAEQKAPVCGCFHDSEEQEEIGSQYEERRTV